MLKLGVIGAGSHSRGDHLPTMARLRDAAPGRLALACICDRRREAADEARQAFVAALETGAAMAPTPRDVLPTLACVCALQSGGS